MYILMILFTINWTRVWIEQTIKKIRGEEIWSKLSNNKQTKLNNNKQTISRLSTFEIINLDIWID